MNRKPPLIAIVCNQELTNNPAEPRIDEVNTHYTRAILNQGGIPFLIPVEFPLGDISLIFEMFDGLLLIGGEDVAIERFGGRSHESVSVPNLERDEIEIELTRLAMAKDFPLLGICRGTQVMNVAMGGSLITDIPSQCPHALLHQRPKDAPPDLVPEHPVRLLPNTMLRAIYETGSLKVNSYHHQAVDRLADCFRPAAYCEDGISEAYEAPDRRFVAGIQWHPERMQDRPDQRKLFRAFVQACSA